MYTKLNSNKEGNLRGWFSGHASNGANAGGFILHANNAGENRNQNLSTHFINDN